MIYYQLYAWNKSKAGLYSETLRVNNRDLNTTLTLEFHPTLTPTDIHDQEWHKNMAVCKFWLTMWMCASPIKIRTVMT